MIYMIYYHLKLTKNKFLKFSLKKYYQICYGGWCQLYNHDSYILLVVRHKQHCIWGALRRVNWPRFVCLFFLTVQIFACVCHHMKVCSWRHQLQEQYCIVSTILYYNTILLSVLYKYCFISYCSIFVCLHPLSRSWVTVRAWPI